MRYLLAGAFLSAVLYSCSLFLDTGSGGPALSLLTIQSGEPLSSSTADDITPFYYHDTNTATNWLFFSSDRDGSFDIYYAEMNPDGTFKNPVKMATNINTPADEISPVVYFGPYTLANGFYRQFISFLRVSAGQTNLVAAMLGTNFSFGSVYQTVNNLNYTRISLFNQTNVDGNPDLICCLGKINWFMRGWGIGSWGAEISTNNFSNSTAAIYSMNAFLEEWTVGANQHTNYYLMDISVGGKRQLYLGRNGSGGVYGVAKIPLYSSVYNDRDANIDLFTKKVYFSSDRKGNYDLYRYNIVTFDKVWK